MKKSIGRQRRERNIEQLIDNMKFNLMAIENNQSLFNVNTHHTTPPIELAEKVSNEAIEVKGLLQDINAMNKY